MPRVKARQPLGTLPAGSKVRTGTKAVKLRFRISEDVRGGFLSIQGVHLAWLPSDKHSRNRVVQSTIHIDLLREAGRGDRDGNESEFLAGFDASTGNSPQLTSTSRKVHNCQS